ncbi:MAG: hypothetical protein JST92_03970 [Deltaproteobacteria bacterium]|nr:hypothetical protein [Deltaproteobacteria bacterium]
MFARTGTSSGCAARTSGAAVTSCVALLAAACAGACGKDAGTQDAGVDAGADAGHPAQFCDGVTDDPLGPTAAQSLQRCLDATPDGGTLELPPLTFSLGAQLQITRPLTLRTATLGGDRRSCLQVGITCATLQAAPTLDAEGGVLVLGVTDHATLDHLVIDGNRGARLHGSAWTACQAGQLRHGQNLASTGCTDCAFTYSASVNALCGSALEWLGDGAHIAESIFQDNGDATSAGRADGLTLLRSDDADVSDNFFVDNSGVGLSIGGARNGTLATNQLRLQSVDTVAAIWLHGAGGASTGDFTGAQLSGNSIDCGAQLCDFGIALGSHAWDHAVANTSGGTVTANSIAGAKWGILAEGAGTASALVKVLHNTVNRPVTSATFSCGQRATASIDLSPDSLVDVGDDTTATASVEWHDCP